ncbi:MAG: type II toxin-antitoxin system HicA family toxin [Candidatus Parabeggiatoa sp.]|nr:type II toxin-antitoxin system HicA family toxin [Candidatus Parabeggiatoa sp.]
MKSISGKAFAQILEKKGWQLMRIKGSHHADMKSGNLARISVHIHGNKPLKVSYYTNLSVIDVQKNNFTGR